MVLETYEVVRDSQIFLKHFFCPQNLENAPKMSQKQDFLNLLNNLVINWSPGLGRKGPIKWVCPFFRPSFRPSFCLSISFLEIGSLVFLWNLAWCYWPIYSCVWQPDFLEKILIRQKWPKMVTNSPKTWFLDFLVKLHH